MPTLHNPAIPRLEDYVRMFHANCGGIVRGPLNYLICAECGLKMDAFVTTAGETELASRRSDDFTTQEYYENLPKDDTTTEG